MFPKTHLLFAPLKKHYHGTVALHYGGVNHTMNLLLSRFRAPKLRAQVRRVLSDCIPCRRRLARPRRPPEGPLPEFRVPKEQPIAFEHTAVDCAGPYKVKRGRTKEICYMVLFTCCQVRAVRLEWLSSLSVDAFLLALTRVAARGVNPRTILSDNGSNFDGTNTLLVTLWSTMPLDELQQKRPDIKWQFNPPYASHYGGVFERLIGAAKQALYHALPAHLSLTLEQLITAFYTVEGILNSRPLSCTSSDCGDISALTPNNFLYGAASQPLLMALQDGAGCTNQRRWEELQRIVRMFQKRFALEIRPAMLHTHRMGDNSRDLMEGDIVTFFLPTAQQKWPLARVAKTFPGKDGRVRTVQLLLPKIQEGKPYKRGKDVLFIRDVGEVALLLPQDQF